MPSAATIAICYLGLKPIVTTHPSAPGLASEKKSVVPPPSAPEAKFQILAADALSSLQQARKLYANSPLELRILYARAEGAGRS